MAKGCQTDAVTTSKSVRWNSQFRFRNVVLWLILIISPCACRSSAAENQRSSRHHNYFKLDAKINVQKNKQDLGGKCSLSAAGTRQVGRGLRLPLVHIHGSCSPLRPANTSWESVFLQTLEGDRFRVQALHSRILGNISAFNSANIPVNSGDTVDTGGYVTTIGLGTPEEDYVLRIDTGSDISWIQCKPCTPCFPQKGPVFDPMRSSSYQTIQCMSPACNELRKATVTTRACFVGDDCLFGIVYYDQSSIDGTFALETVTVGYDVFKNFAFGCGHNVHGFSGLAGILGLGRSPLALPSQTKTKYGSSFSYCLPEFLDPEEPGSLTFGEGAVPKWGVFTEMLTSPEAPSFYFLGLTDISVGGYMLNVSSREVFTDTILDSGTVVTRLVEETYNALKSAFLKKAPNIGKRTTYSIFDTCFQVRAGTRPKIPGIILHFSDGAKLYLRDEGVLTAVDKEGTILCFAFAASTGHLNIIGAIQQLHFRVSYDLENQKLGFSPQKCTTE